MVETSERLSWNTIGASVRGSSHRRSGAPNQDAYHTRVGPGGVWIVAAVADGHGSERSFRSDIGSRIAAMCGTDLASEFASRTAALDTASIRASAITNLPKEIVREWTKAVLLDYTESPPTSAECYLMKQQGLAPEKMPVSDVARLYGSTVIIVIVTPRYQLYLQLGDGDIVSVSQAGEVTRPVNPDSSLIANETTSLCMQGAESLFRYRFFDCNETPPPKIIMLSTDGYSNSFQSNADFEAVGPDIARMLDSEGEEFIVTNLSSWLQDVSDEGSGDDITCCIVFGHTAREANAQSTTKRRTLIQKIGDLLG